MIDGELALTSHGGSEGNGVVDDLSTPPISAENGLATTVDVTQNGGYHTPKTSEERSPIEEHVDRVLMLALEDDGQLTKDPAGNVTTTMRSALGLRFHQWDRARRLVETRGLLRFKSLSPGSQRIAEVVVEEEAFSAAAQDGELTPEVVVAFEERTKRVQAAAKAEALIAATFKREREVAAAEPRSLDSQPSEQVQSSAVAPKTPVAEETLAPAIIYNSKDANEAGAGLDQLSTESDVIEAGTGVNPEVEVDGEEVATASTEDREVIAEPAPSEEIEEISDETPADEEEDQEIEREDGTSDDTETTPAEESEEGHQEEEEEEEQPEEEGLDPFDENRFSGLEGHLSSSRARRSDEATGKNAKSRRGNDNRSMHFNVRLFDQNFIEAIQAKKFNALPPTDKLVLAVLLVRSPQFSSIYQTPDAALGYVQNMVNRGTEKGAPGYLNRRGLEKLIKGATDKGVLAIQDEFPELTEQGMTVLMERKGKKKW